MKTVVIFSGGLDSTTLLYSLKADNHEIYSLSIDYGQRHSIELQYAENTVRRLGIPHRMINLKSVAQLFHDSCLTNQSLGVPEGHYEEEKMRLTVVPNRNMILLSIAASWAISLKADTISYAAHSGDHAIYPDCRPEFTDAMDRAIQLADWHSVKLFRPFIDLAKSDIVKMGSKLSVPFDQTWSCYKGNDLHCGCCGTCIERREAFYLAGITDPTEYAELAPDLTVLIKNKWKI